MKKADIRLDIRVLQYKLKKEKSKYKGDIDNDKVKCLQKDIKELYRLLRE